MDQVGIIGSDLSQEILEMAFAHEEVRIGLFII